MASAKSKIERNLEAINEQIAAACDRAGRSPRDVSLVAVTKSVGLTAIRSAVEVGLTDLGENRVQQLTQRAGELAAALAKSSAANAQAVRWHMIGHLQRNKVKAALEVAEVIHSVDSLRLAEQINARAEQMDKTVDVLLQVNCSQERQKFGVAVGAAKYLGELVCTLKHLHLIGLMTMAPLVGDAELGRPSFVRLRELFDEMRNDGVGGADFRHLSMGMSQDYAVAVEEGATILRIGTAIFG